MKKILVLILCIVFNGLALAQQTREEKLQQLKNRDDIKVTEVEPNILKLEYPNGKVLYKNIADYKPQTHCKISYSPTFDSTIIDLTTIDTTLYYQKYKYWQEVPLCNFSFNHVLVGDINNNGKTELYGARKYYETETEPVSIYEINNSDKFQFRYQYDSAFLSWNIYDLDKDGNNELHLLGATGSIGEQRFFTKVTDTSFATQLMTSFTPYDSSYQTDDVTLGDFDGDENTDMLFARGAGGGDIHIFEYNPIVNTFDPVYRFMIYDTGQRQASGFSINDFDLDGKTDIVFGTGMGYVYVVENTGNDQYTNSWFGKVETYAAYRHTWSKDIDRNGKPEFWVLGEAFYNGVGITRITLFETNGDNSYQQVGRIDLVSVFSFYAGTIQAVDIDNDGIEELAICIDDNFLILKFNGSEDHQTYEVFYLKQVEQFPIGEFLVYYGAIMIDLLDNGQFEILITMVHIIEQPGDDWGKFETRFYKPDSTSYINDVNYLLLQNNLYQNYPNPFNPTTNVQFCLSSSTNTSIKIYNVLGKEVRTLLDKYLPAGEHTVQWDGNDDKGNILPVGIYFIHMIASSYQQTIKTIILK